MENRTHPPVPVMMFINDAHKPTSSDDEQDQQIHPDTISGTSSSNSDLNDRISVHRDININSKVKSEINECDSVANDSRCRTLLTDAFNGNTIENKDADNSNEVRKTLIKEGFVESDFSVIKQEPEDDFDSSKLNKNIKNGGIIDVSVGSFPHEQEISAYLPPVSTSELTSGQDDKDNESNVDPPKTKKKRVHHDPEKVQAAIDEYKSKKISIREAARKYGIPRQTLSDKILGNTPVGRRIYTLLTAEEENKLAEWLLILAHRGFGKTKTEICQTAKKILQLRNIESKSADCTPSPSWCRGFLSRHPQLTLRTPMLLDEMLTNYCNGIALQHQIKNKQSTLCSDFDKRKNQPELLEHQTDLPGVTGYNYNYYINSLQQPTTSTSLDSKDTPHQSFFESSNTFGNDSNISGSTHTCAICNKLFSSNGSLKIHMKIHTDPKGHKCVHCGRGFTQTSNLKIHLRKHTGEQPFECVVCSKTFISAQSLKLHVMASHIGHKPFKCDVCDRGFSQEVHLKAHAVVHTKMKPYKCLVCNKGFSQKGNLDKHMNNHIRPEPYKCSSCDKKFPTNGMLMKHMRSHDGGTLFICSVCKKSFKQRIGLESHMNTHIGQKPHACSLCNKSFCQIRSLRKHMVVHDKYKKFKCAECDKEFYKGDCLKTHMLIHSGYKPHQCSLCQKSFMNKGKLNRHLRSHRGEKPHQCLICFKAFSESAGLKRHITNIHNK